MGSESKTQKRQRRKIICLSKELDQKCAVIKVAEARLEAANKALKELEDKDRPTPEDV